MFVLHETCLEYFRRRLAEGWECISLEGHNAVLLSPDGNVRREIDLRNDIETRYQMKMSFILIVLHISEIYTILPTML